MDPYTRNPKTRHFHQVFTWCAACEHVYTTTAWAELGWQCPRCSAPAIDARPWEEFRRSHLTQPVEPSVGWLYPWEPEPARGVFEPEPALGIAA